MNLFEKELQTMFGDNDILSDVKISGKTLIAKLDDNLRAKIQFATEMYADHYSALKLKIINRTEGEVDSVLFRFSDIIGKIERKNGLDPISPYIWKDGDNADWYGFSPLPSERAKIADTVLDYAQMYQAPQEQTSSMQL